MFIFSSKFSFSIDYFPTNISDELVHLQTIDELVRFLCTDQARSLTGRIIPFHGIFAKDSRKPC